MKTKGVESVDLIPNMQPLVSDAERRESHRSQFDAQALVAFIVGDELPSKHDFQLIECLDLSGTGFSFYWPAKPLSQRLVVILRKCGGYVSFSAQVMNSRFVNEDHLKQVLVGCRFGRQLAMPINSIVQGMLPVK